VERGPLPPHERTWRHPSELAAEERALIVAEPSPRGARFLALATGTLGLLAVGLLMITITPQRTDSPILLSASTTPIATAQGAGRSAAAAIVPAATEAVGLRSESARVLATPIGDGRFALVTRESLAGSDDTVIDVRLPSGQMSAGSIVTASEDAVVVALAVTEPGHAIASDRPGDRDMVTVMATPPITVAYDDVDTLAVEEGTAVVDDDGNLVGICSRRSGSRHVRLIEVSAELDAATSVVP
jgi:hypothetical protein